VGNQLSTLEGCPEKVGGDFSCGNNQLTSLRGCPEWVGGNFNCSKNKLTTLEGCPERVGGDFYCSNNQLSSLIGCPKNVIGDFYCNSNQLTSLEGLEKVGGNFYCVDNQLTSLVGIPEIGYLHYDGNPIFEVTYSWLENYGKPDMDKIELFNDLDIIVGDKLYWSKLEYFHEEINVPLPDMEEIKKYYTIIE